jgi:hypothetical protein
MYTNMENKIINMAVNTIVVERHKNGGKIPRGLIPDLINTLQEQRVVVTRDVLYGRLRRCLETTAPTPVPPFHVILEPSETTTVSTLTATNTIEETETGTPSTVHESMESHESNMTSDTVIQENKSTRSSGRPKGSTKKAKQSGCAKKARLMNAITLAYSAKVRENKMNNKLRVPKGYLKKLEAEKREELGIESTVNINLRSIQARQFGKYLTPLHRGTPSPLRELERIVLPIVMQMAKVRQPMRPPEVIALVNSFLDGTIHQQKLISWKKIHEPNIATDNDLGKIGVGYFNRFMKRHGPYLDSSVGRKFAVDRSDWLKPGYLQDMYDSIYKIFEEAGVASHSNVPVAYDFSGRIVQLGSPFQYGLTSNIIVEHADHILFGDETGINTNQLDDGRVGGTRYIVPRGCVPLVQANKSDHRATVLPLTAATGEPVVCAVIFASEKTSVESSWHTGIDITVDPIVDEHGNVDAKNPDNYGPGKYFPSGPTCFFRGKAIPTLTFTSPSATISGEILVKIFKALDDMEIYPRTLTESGSQLPEPCVIVDGHESRLNPSFLNYINDKRHRWNFCLGVPYLTHLWQVADSPEQNGSFKSQLARAKEELMSFKLQKGMTARLNTTDIIPLLNIAWGKSFANIESNKRAVASRGWYPPTKKILQDPSLWDLQDEEMELFPNTLDDGIMTASNIATMFPPLVEVDAFASSANTDAVDINTLAASVNTTTGKAANVIDALLSHAARKDGTKRRINALVEGESRQKIFLHAKKITSGLMIKAGCYSCNDPILLAAIKEKEEKKNMEQESKDQKAKAKVSLLRSQVKNIHETRGLDPMKWNIQECRAFLQYKKRKGDSKMPTSLQSLQLQCKDWMYRPSPPCSPTSARSC